MSIGLLLDRRGMRLASQGDNAQTFVLLGDAHLVTEGNTLYGQDPVDQLRKIIDVVNEDHCEACAAFFLGNLVQNGLDSEYLTAKALISRLCCSAFIIVGNHDNRRRVAATFPGHSIGPEGFLQYCVDAGKIRFVVLDTVCDGTANGALCERRLAWLDHQLAGTDRRVVILMHHQPLAVGLNIDSIRLRDGDALAEVLCRHRRVIELIVFGHIHRTTCGT
ncbi:MAG: 3',5'-cyclic-nucleotide phosphodiesterase (EC [uncultured Caballeronia sp.]|nr:MAG: 3',5'-cyclic-nucleotide phosphodiesterase (EC [uncultured Caballeronia sp.]